MPTHVIGPEMIGPPHPPTGYSTFDALFGTLVEGRLRYRIPYPFPELLDTLARHESERDQSAGESTGGIVAVLIPLGRSMDRAAARPHYFASPRIVLAVDTEPAEPRLARPVFLRDRLFLAYQPAVARLHIISYNEPAGRFEFQVVQDYRAGADPKVSYANRLLCVSCHQNVGPIFSRPDWRETHVNPSVAARLVLHQSNFHGIETAPEGANPARIDAATDRANRLSALQLIWREGCASGARIEETIRCRAGALEAMLQYRLGTFASIDTQSTLFWDYFIPIVVKGWRMRWPAGLAVPSADLENYPGTLRAGVPYVPANQDPLRLRAPKAIWTVDDINPIVRAMGESLASGDLRRLDAHLFATGRDEHNWRWKFRGPCRFANHGPLAQGRLVSVECEMGGGATDRRFNLIADLAIGTSHVHAHNINSLQLSDGTRFTGLVHLGGAIAGDEENRSVRLELRQRASNLHPWLPDGSALADVELRWSDSALSADSAVAEEVFLGQGTLTLVPGFEAVSGAIEALVGAAERGESDVLRSDTFRPTQLLGAILSRMGVNPIAWCCSDWERARITLAEAPEPEPATLPDVPVLGHALVVKHCATCHAPSPASPPPAITQDERVTASNLVRCAQRVLFRLSMWRFDEEERSKTPMPPPFVLETSDAVAHRFVQDELETLSSYVRSMSTQSGSPITGDLLEREYETLDECTSG